MEMTDASPPHWPVGGTCRAIPTYFASQTKEERNQHFPFCLFRSFRLLPRHNSEMEDFKSFPSQEVSTSLFFSSSFRGILRPENEGISRYGTRYPIQFVPQPSFAKI